MNEDTKRHMQRQMQQAKAMIQQKRYDDARAILITIDHPKADAWLKKLNSILSTSQPQTSESKAKSIKSSRSQKIKIGLIVAGILFVVLFFVIDNTRVEFNIQESIRTQPTHEAEVRQYCAENTRGQAYFDCLNERLYGE